MFSTSRRTPMGQDPYLTGAYFTCGTMTETTTMWKDCAVEYTILHTLLYFELFSYPLTAREIAQFAYSEQEPGNSDSDAGYPALFQEKLQGLVENGRVFRFQDFYQTSNQAEWAERRVECNRRAEACLPKARRMAQRIAAFPYIRAVFVSGSLSKHCMRPDSDVDFFLVTTPGRLWLARTLLVLYKKIFLLNSHKYFCINYFVDTEHLEIEEKNLFTATEIVTLLPMYGKDWYHSFYNKNRWAWQRYARHPLRSTEAVPTDRASRFKRVAEWCLRGALGDWLDGAAMRVTVGFWKRKFSHFDESTFQVALKSRRYVSKHHPLYFQQKILQQLALRLRETQAQVPPNPVR